MSPILARTPARRSPRPLLLLLMVALAAALLPAATAEAASDKEHELACLANEARRDAGRSEFRVSSDLASLARSHARTMAREGRLYHNPTLSSDVKSWNSVGENVGYGSDVAKVHRALMNSSGHRANLLSKKFTQVGMGVAVDDHGRTWVTQVFRAPRGSVSSKKVDCGGGGGDAAATPGDEVALSGDWNGDGRETPATFSDGQWTMAKNLSGDTLTTFTFGRRGDLPIVGDWNGDGRDTIGIIRDGTWHLRNSLSGGAGEIVFDYGRTTRGDLPLIGDWNGDGRDTIGIIRDGEWHLRHSLSSGPGQVVFTYGRTTRGDLPLVGDWNGDGRDTIGIVRAGGEWHLRRSLAAGPADEVFVYGRVAKQDTPVIGDWNGDGRSGVGIVRGRDWHLRHSLTAGVADTTLRF